MKTYTLLILISCYVSTSLFSQAPLRLVTFNSANATYSQGVNITGSDDIYAANTWAHLAIKGAIAPEPGWYIFVGKSGTNAWTLYTMQPSTGNVVYSAPATFLTGTYSLKEIFYSDTLGALVGLIKDSNQVTSFASCNLQTGAISTIRPISFDYSYIAAYNHANEKYYYIGQTNDTTLYTLDPVSGQLDSVDLPFMNASYQLVDLQYDNTHQLLYALYNDFGILGPRIQFRTINPATGASSMVYSPVLGNDIWESVNLFAFDEANQKYIYSDRAAGNTLGVADMINGTNTRYNLNTIVPTGEILTHLEFDYYSNTLYALRKIANQAPVQPLCLVSVDSTSSHNVIVWEKTDKAATVTYNLFRETTTNVFTLLATIDRDSLSEYHDYTANPNITGYRYQMTVTDTSGNVSAPSTPHQTIHLQYSGSGNLSWVGYSGSASPVTTYDIYCDSLGNGNWLLMGSVPASQTTYTDIQYLNHPAALYRLAANFPFSCTAARSIGQAWSNTASAQSVGLFNDVPEENVQLYPVPAINQFIISGSPVELVSIYNANGQLLSRLQNPLNNRVDVSGLNSGLYFVTAYKAGKTYTHKLLVSH